MKKILVCTNFRANPQHASCAGRGSKLLLTKLSSEFSIDQAVASPCLGACEIGPNIRLAPDGPYFHEVTAAKLEALLPAIHAFIAD